VFRVKYDLGRPKDELHMPQTSKTTTFEEVKPFP